jgi:hypothetical protein|tara:strand:- start:872 stop:1063 length:192 start_codon:yes stop_codon:yes gene_type:complete
MRGRAGQVPQHRSKKEKENEGGVELHEQRKGLIGRGAAQLADCMAAVCITAAAGGLPVSGLLG